MTLARKAQIVGTGRYIPETLVTNADLEKLMDTSDEWIKQRSGISTRFHALKSQETSDLALEASQKALDNANINAQDLHMIITATLSPDHHFPGIGVKLQHKLGLETTPAMDIRNQCSGFLYALNTAKLFVNSGQYKRILVVGSEIHSKLVDFTTRGRDISVLFGDGAGAVVIEANDSSGGEILSFDLHSEGKHFNKLWLDRPGTSGERFMDQEALDEARHFPYMEGRAVFKHATTRLIETVKTQLDLHKMGVGDVDHFLFHQANLRINEYVAQKLGIPMEKVHNNIQKYGNCSAASLPILLDEYRELGQIKQGDLIMMAAFGAGFTWGSCTIRI